MFTIIGFTLLPVKSRGNQCLCKSLDDVIRLDRRDHPDRGRQLMITTQLVLPAFPQALISYVTQRPNQRVNRFEGI